MPPEDMASLCDMASSGDGEEIPLETILEGVDHANRKMLAEDTSNVSAPITN